MISRSEWQFKRERFLNRVLRTQWYFPCSQNDLIAQFVVIHTYFQPFNLPWEQKLCSNAYAPPNFFVVKRQNQQPWLSTHSLSFWTYTFTPFPLGHWHAKVNYLPLNTSIFKIVFDWKDLTFPVQIPHHSQARFNSRTHQVQTMKLWNGQYGRK